MASDYPGSIDTFRPKSNLPGVVFDPAQEPTIFAEDFAALENDVIAVETTLGTNPQGSESDVAMRLAAIESAIAAMPSELDILAAAYPIGSYYINETNATNPGTLLGFGTWAAAAAGRVPAGKASSGTFGTAGATFGEETHLLTGAESGLKNHNHGLLGVNGASMGNGSTYPGLSDNTNRDTFSAIQDSSSIDASNAHNNIQPTIVVYIWKRTA